MNKQEFEQMVGKEISHQDYEMIDKVYTWHPSIRNVDGKEQITAIYQAGGMLVIKNMLETADIMMNLDTERRELEAQIKARIKALDDRTNWVRSGNLNYERCLQDVEAALTRADSPQEFAKVLQPIKARYGDSTVDRVIKDKELD